MITAKLFTKYFDIFKSWISFQKEYDQYFVIRFNVYEHKETGKTVLEMSSGPWLLPFIMEKSAADHLARDLFAVASPEETKAALDAETEKL